MPQDIARLRWLLARFSEEPLNPELSSVGRDLADRFTLDQLEAMAQHRAKEVAPLFDQLLGRTLWKRPLEPPRNASSRERKGG